MNPIRRIHLAAVLASLAAALLTPPLAAAALGSLYTTPTVNPALSRSRRCLAPATTWANPRPGEGHGREPGPHPAGQPRAR